MYAREIFGVMMMNLFKQINSTRSVVKGYNAKKSCVDFSFGSSGRLMEFFGRALRRGWVTVWAFREFSLALVVLISISATAGTSKKLRPLFQAKIENLILELNQTPVKGRLVKLEKRLGELKKLRASSPRQPTQDEIYMDMIMDATSFFPKSLNKKECNKSRSEIIRRFAPHAEFKSSDESVELVMGVLSSTCKLVP